MMKLVRIALIGPTLIFALACGKNFQVKSPPTKGLSQETPVPFEKREDVEDIGQFYRVKRNPKNPSLPQQAQKVKIADREYRIERERLQFANLTYDFNESQMILRGQVLLNSQLENFEMSGKIENDIVDLKLVDPNSPFRDRLKARATCYSLTRNEKGQCQRFFIDFYYYDQGVFYTEQLIPKLESLIKEEEKEKTKKPEEEVIESDEVGNSNPGFFSVQNDQDIIDLYPEIANSPVDPVTPVPTQPAPVPEQPSPTPTQPRPQPVPLPTPSPQKPPKTPGKKPPAKKSRPTNQAVGGAKGEESHLRNASNLLEVWKQLGKNAGFQVLNQENERYYGTWDMIQFIKKMGEWVRVSFPNQTLAVRDISKKDGGQLAKHKSHKVGLDADIAYFTKNKSRIMTTMIDTRTNQVSNDLMLDEQLKLFKYMISTGEVHVIFVDHLIKKALCEKATELGEVNGNKDNPLTVRTLNRLAPDFGKDREHSTHFHLRLFCGPYNRACNLGNPGGPETGDLGNQGLGCEAGK